MTQASDDMADPGDLDAQMRRVDPDRWLASRFIADEATRADVIALYAFNHELARAAEVASQPLVAEMRLAWWTEALDEIFAGGRVRGHPGALGLKQAVERRGLKRAPLEALVDARLRELDGWPLQPVEVEPYLEATRGGLMALAAQVLAPGDWSGAVRSAALAWGLAGLQRTPGRLPPDWTARDVARHVSHTRAQANRALRELPPAAFPAVAYAALAPAYAAGRDVSDLGKRARLTWAVLRGRI